MLLPFGLHQSTISILLVLNMTKPGVVSCCHKPIFCTHGNMIGKALLYHPRLELVANVFITPEFSFFVCSKLTAENIESKEKERGYLDYVYLRVNAIATRLS